MNESNGTKYIGSVRFFKNLILLAVIIMIAVPTGFAFHYKGKAKAAENELAELTWEIENQEIWEEDGSGIVKTDSPYQDLYPDFYAPQKLNAVNEEKGVIYLTFDDGPSARTEEILNILKEKDVKATFFVIGKTDDYSKSLMKRIVDEGHTIAMHSYSHEYKTIYASVEAYLADMNELYTLIKDTTGVTPSIFRFPGGSLNSYDSGIYEDLICEMMRRGFVPFDWNVSSQDAATKLQDVNNIIYYSTQVGSNSRSVVLMHDAAGKTTTVEALPTIIDTLKSQGYELKALTPDVKPMLFPYRNVN